MLQLISMSPSSCMHGNIYVLPGWVIRSLGSCCSEGIFQEQRESWSLVHTWPGHGTGHVVALQWEEGCPHSLSWEKSRCTKYELTTSGPLTIALVRGSTRFYTMVFCLFVCSFVFPVTVELKRKDVEILNFKAPQLGYESFCISSNDNGGRCF